MLNIVLNIEQQCTDYVAHEDCESSLFGYLKIKASDRLELDQIVIQLIKTEQVDSSDGANGSPSSSTVCIWKVLPKNGTTYILQPGTHRYNINMPLPKGLDGLTETRANTLLYQLETRLEYSNTLNKYTKTLTSIELDQVPIAREPIPPSTAYLSNATDISPINPVLSTSFDPLMPVSSLVLGSFSQQQQQFLEQLSRQFCQDGLTSESAAARVSHLGTSGQSSPPQNYEELLPSGYEVPETQPPPYNEDENGRSRRIYD